MRLIQRWLILMLIGLVAQAAPLWGQATPTAEPATPLPFGQPVAGSLSSGESIVYRFEIPRDQDVVIVITADKVVTDLHCTETVTATETQRECPGGGGGDGDGPVYRVSYFPMNANPDVRQFIEMTVYRPDAFDSAAHYVLTSYLVTPQPLALDTIQPVDDGDPFHVYTIESDLAQAFTLEVEQDDPDGEFLWAAYEPYRNLLDASDQPADDQYVDGAVANPPNALTTLWLFYSGGETFHALVGASGAYTLYGSTIAAPDLEVGTQATVTVSHRQPISLVRLTNSANGTLTANLTQGESVRLGVYPDEQRSTVWSLGYSQAAGAQGPSTRIIDLPDGANDTTIVVSLPSQATRKPVAVTVEWEPQ